MFYTNRKILPGTIEKNKFVLIVKLKFSLFYIIIDITKSLTES